MIRRIKNFFFWMLREFTQKENTADIYNDLIANNQYDVTVDYPARVEGLKTALKLVTNNYHSMLDLACGTGAFIDALPNKKHLLVTGVDISEGMLSVAKKRFSVYENIHFKQASFLDVTFSKESFDLITVAHATRFIPQNKEIQFANAIAAWLKKEGTFIVVVNIYPLPIFLTFFHKLTGIFIGANILMQDKDYLTKRMKPHFYLEKEKIIESHYKLLKVKALYFRKRV